MAFVGGSIESAVTEAQIWERGCCVLGAASRCSGSVSAGERRPGV